MSLTVEDWLKALQEAEASSSFPDGMSTAELSELLHIPQESVGDMLRKLAKQSLVECSMGRRRNIVGNMGAVPVYRLRKK